jgi:HK97 family phage prohead protease
MPTATLTKPRGGLVHKTVDVHVERTAGAGERVRRFVLTTDALDRDFEVVVPSGGRFDEYLKNPQLLWAHKYDQLPVGKCLGLKLANSGRWLVGDFEFARTKFANDVYGLYRDGFLRAVSIGFRALEVGPPVGEMLAARPELASKCLRVIKRWNLFEVSCVPIPSNAEALEVAVQKGLVSDALWHELAPALGSNRLSGQIKSRIVRELGWSPERVEALTLKEAVGLLDLVDKGKKPRVVPTDQEPRDDDGTPRRKPAEEDADEEIDEEAVDPSNTERKPAAKPPRANGQASAPVKIAIRTDQDIARDVAHSLKPAVNDLATLCVANAMVTLLGRDTARRSR